jgi:acetyl-CoA/propionyl-CoA carboxylase biotin carboxyl carrier protein
VVGGAFDSLLAKLIITGETREEALQRARRALAEFSIDGLATVLPFDRAVVDDPAFTAADGVFAVHTRWIETEFENTIEPFAGASNAADDAAPRQTIVAEVNGRRVTVTLPGELSIAAAPAGSTHSARPSRARRGAKAPAAVSGDAVVAPMQGTVVKIAVGVGDTVATGDLIAVVEAMKMENPVVAHQDGTVADLPASVGETVSSGAVLATIQPSA